MARKKKIEILPMLQDMGVDLDEPTQKIIKLLERRKTMAENKLADRLKLKINATRKLLYRLQSRGLITYSKQRDEKKKWWYLYFWSLDMNRINELYVNHLRKQLERKRAELIAESKYVFECKICNQKFTYEDALETEFACSQCGELLEEVTDGKVARRLKREIATIEVELIEAAKPMPKPKPKPAKPKKKPKKKKPKKPKKKVKGKRKPKPKKKKTKKKTKTKKKSITKRVLRKVLLRKKK